jgi:hypothetical protein
MAMPTVQLNKEDEFRDVTGWRLLDVSESTVEDTDVWPYVEELVLLGLVPKYVAEGKIVAHVFRDGERTFDHVLLSTGSPEDFIVVVIDLATGQIKGHFEWNLAKYFGLER